VILGAFVNLRRIAVCPGNQLLPLVLTYYDIQAETTEMFYSSTGVLAHSDVNYDVVLGNCNRKLTQWMDTWEFQMKRGTFISSSCLSATHTCSCSSRGTFPLLASQPFPPVRATILKQFRHTGFDTSGIFELQLTLVENTECQITGKSYQP